MTTATKNITQISESLYLECVKTLREVTDFYQSQLKRGVDQDIILQQIVSHVRQIAGSSVPDSEKEDASDKLEAFVRTNLMNAKDFQSINWAELLKPDVKQWTQDQPEKARRETEEEVVAKWTARLSGKYPTVVAKPSMKTDDPRLSHADIVADYQLEIEALETILSEGFLSNLFHKKPDTHIFYHEPTKTFVGTLHGKPLKASTEKMLFKTLTQTHGYKPEVASIFTDKVRGGNPTGVGDTTALHHLGHALYHAQSAASAHQAKDMVRREHHMKMINHHLDKGLELATDHFRHNPKELAGLNHKHPLVTHVDTIANIIKHIKH